VGFAPYRPYPSFEASTVAFCVARLLSALSPLNS
jgi:hypothetical protein